MLCAGALLFLALSCQVTPEAAQPVPTSLAAAGEARAATGSEAPAELEAAILDHLLRYRHRSGLSDRELAGLARIIVAESDRYQLDPALVLAVMHVESRFNTYAVSPKDALGLMQLLPSTGAWLAPQVGVDWQGPQTLFDPASNVRLGVAYLRQLVDRYDGNIRTALLAYNWGPGRIDQRLRRGSPPPREYAQLVFAAYSPRGAS
jgi:soluble lytic murein transglycosylase